MAQACLIEPQSCETPNGGNAIFGGNEGAVVLFSEYGPGDAHSAVVVECESRHALAISPPNDHDWNDFWDAERLINDAVFDDQPHTFRQLARQIRRETGVEARAFTLPDGHCGCDLPQIAPPPVACPVF